MSVYSNTKFSIRRKVVLSKQADQILPQASFHPKSLVSRYLFPCTSNSHLIPPTFLQAEKGYNYRCLSSPVVAVVNHDLLGITMSMS